MPILNLTVYSWAKLGSGKPSKDWMFLLENWVVVLCTWHVYYYYYYYLSYVWQNQLNSNQRRSSLFFQKYKSDNLFCFSRDLKMRILGYQSQIIDILIVIYQHNWLCHQNPASPRFATGLLIAALKLWFYKGFCDLSSPFTCYVFRRVELSAYIIHQLPDRNSFRCPWMQKAFVSHINNMRQCSPDEYECNSYAILAEPIVDDITFTYIASNIVNTV